MAHPYTYIHSAKARNGGAIPPLHHTSLWHGICTNDLVYSVTDLKYRQFILKITTRISITVVAVCKQHSVNLQALLTSALHEGFPCQRLQTSHPVSWRLGGPQKQSEGGVEKEPLLLSGIEVLPCQ
jgi:hypothetical protein